MTIYSQNEKDTDQQSWLLNPLLAHMYLKSLLLMRLLLATTVVVNVGKKSWYVVALQGSTGQYDLL